MKRVQTRSQVKQTDSNQSRQSSDVEDIQVLQDVTDNIGFDKSDDDDVLQASRFAAVIKDLTRDFGAWCGDRMPPVPCVS